MTLDALEAQLKPILIKFPMARFVLVGVPGSPNTIWPSHWILNPDLQSRAVAKLMKHLHETDRLASYRFPPEHLTRSKEDTEPIFFMGFGIGGHTLSRFIDSFLPELPWLQSRIRVILLVNTILKIAHPFKKMCMDLRRGMLMGSHPEIHSMFASLHFKDDYLLRNGREKVLDLFWSYREGLSLAGVPMEQAGLAYVGILEQLKGLILASKDGFDGASILRTEIPVVVVHSTENNFVSPTTASVYQADQLPYMRHLVTSMADCLDAGAVHVSWLNSSHEVLQERTNFLLGLVANVAQICGVHPIFETIDMRDRRKAREDEELLDMMKESERRALQREAERNALDASKLERERAKQELKRQKKDAKKMANEIERRELEEAAALNLAQATAVADEMQKERDRLLAQELEERTKLEARLRKERLEEEKLAQRLRGEERKRRKDEQIKEQLMRELLEQSTEYLDVERAKYETLAMEKEDTRSHFANQYYLYEESCKYTHSIVKDKVDELYYSRRMAAIKRVEDRLAREQMNHRFVQRRAAEAALKQMVIDDLDGFEEDLNVYVSTEDPDINKIIKSARAMLQNFMDCRVRFVDVLRRQVLTQEKMDSFMTVVDSMVKDLQKKQRELQKLKKKHKESRNKKDGKAYIERERKIDELKTFVDKEAARTLDIMALMESRRGSVDAVNFSCQRLKTLVHEKDDRLRLYQAKMRTLESFYLKKLKTIKVEKEYIQTFKDKCVYKVLVCRQHQELLRKELNRISGHQAHFVDSTMWTEGVVQRVVTKPFRKHLITEIRKEKATEASLLKELEGHRESILECSIRMEKTKREGDKITIGLKIIKKTYDVATKYSMAEVIPLRVYMLFPLALIITPFQNTCPRLLGDEAIIATTS